MLRYINLTNFYKRLFKPYDVLRKLSTASPNFEAMNQKISLPERYRGVPEVNVWVEFIKLAMEYKPLNLGQGFPDYGCPKYVTETLKQVMDDPNLLMNQYTRGYGHPRLVNVLADLYGPCVGRKIDPMREILVSQGAYGCLHSAIQSLVSPGDEVIIMEPYFDCYSSMVLVAGGNPIYIPLVAPTTSYRTVDSDCFASDVEGSYTRACDWSVDWSRVQSALASGKVRALILNTPHNPLGKVFTREELQRLSHLCLTSASSHRLVCVSDEVYEWMVYPVEGAAQHTRIASLPGMWERTVTIGSAGKTFSVTGWKLGWAYGPESLISAMGVVHQNTLYTCNTPIQETVARAFEHELSCRDDKDQCFLTSLAAELRSKRDVIVNALIRAGMRPVIPDAGYFILADWTSLDMSRVDMGSVLSADNIQQPYTDMPRDKQFVYWLVHKYKLLAIPPSAFYSTQHTGLAEPYIRFCFIKEDENLLKAGSILNNLREDLQSIS